MHEPNKSLIKEMNQQTNHRGTFFFKIIIFFRNCAMDGCMYVSLGKRKMIFYNPEYYYYIYKPEHCFVS